MAHLDKSARPCAALEHSPKRRQILAGAREVFGEMEADALRAGMRC